MSYLPNDPYYGASDWERGIKWQDIIDNLKTGTNLPALPEGSEVIRVVGVSFVPEYPENLRRLASKHAQRKAELFVELRRNPDNKFDSNAVEVRFFGEMLGHIPKDIAARLAPVIDAGNTYIASVYQVLINPEAPQYPGLDILLFR